LNFKRKKDLAELQVIQNDRLEKEKKELENAEATLEQQENAEIDRLEEEEKELDEIAQDNKYTEINSELHQKWDIPNYWADH